jgi:hypothetical protein
MSSPLDGDSGADQLSIYAPKWARGPARVTRRETASMSQQDTIDDDAEQSSAARSSAGLAIGGYRLPPSLEPTAIPEHGPVAPVRSGIFILAGFALVLAVAAILSLFVVGKFPMSWTGSEKDREQGAPAFGSRFSGQNPGMKEEPRPQLSLRQEAPRRSGEAFPLGASLTAEAEGASVVIEGLANGLTVTAGQSLGGNTWQVPASALRNALVQPPEGYVGAMDVTLELRLGDDTPVDRKPLHLEWIAAAPPQINVVTQSPTDLKQTFDQFVENYTASTGQTTFSARDREILFTKFQQFLDSQVSTHGNR